MILINTNIVLVSSFYRSPCSPSFPGFPPVKYRKTKRQRQDCTVTLAQQPATACSLCSHSNSPKISFPPLSFVFFYSHFLCIAVTKGMLMGMCSTSRPFSVMRCNFPRNFTFFSTNSTGISKALENFVVY